jgi:hypothetical protein
MQHPNSLINPNTVAHVLEEDHAASMAGVASYTLYLLNPKPPKEGSTYSYAYDSG